jgi:hypothetical protein
VLTGGTPEHVSELWQRARSQILTPGQAGWDDARGAWQAAVDQRPDPYGVMHATHPIRP